MGGVILEGLKLLAFDAIFLLFCVLLLAPLGAYKKAAFAVLKRNFTGYFTNPTGYVFLCLFVLLTSLAAFWPHEFFLANLANLDQLNEVLPFIMLIFVPAITMSIWSEEKRLGTDELLLTLPADDFDIVIGKYLAAAAIFTASLIFSQISTYLVLVSLSMGDFDTGLFFATYLGYWFLGLAMLAVGMVASFLTNNMTIGFILGMAFNAPLAFAGSADVIIPSARLARQVSFWGLGTHFDDLGRGVISLSSIAYFVLLTVIGLYLCMVLIGSRHWAGGQDATKRFWHYTARVVCLSLTMVGVVLLLNNHDLIRYDATVGRVSSLSPKTKELIRKLDTEYPIKINAFVSNSVPERYVQTKYSLVSLLKEFDAMSGGKIQVRLEDNLEPFSEEAARAEELFGIRPTTVRTRTRGAFKDEDVILGAAFTCGLEKVVVPFFDYGIPVEYELVRSIGTVAQDERKTVGVVRTDAQLFGGFSFAGGSPQQTPKEEIINELEKQYDVEEVDPTQPIDPASYDVLIIPQPSSLGPQELTNVVDAVRAGVPSAIFEDPAPIFVRAPGTGDPKQSPGGPFGGGGPMPKGDIQQLWRTIGISPPGEPAFHGGFSPDLVWQEYLPYRKLARVRGINDSWVFISNFAPDARRAVNPESPITAGLNEILLPLPGAVRPAPSSDLEFTPLLSTSTKAGSVRLEQFRTNQSDPLRLKAAQGAYQGEPLVVAARIREVSGNEAKDDEDGEQDAGGGDAEADDGGSEGAIDVVYVADVDLLSWQFLSIRARPDEDSELDFRFENVNFLLNVVDVLSGDDDYVEIRRRKPHHTTLKLVEQRIQEQREEEDARRQEFEDNFTKREEELQEKNQEALKKFQDRVENLQERQKQGESVGAELRAAMQELAIKQQQLERALGVSRVKIERDRDRAVERIQRETDLEILKIQNSIKVMAVAIPPILPLLVGLVVFVRRRLREREGIVRSRLRT